ncbi:hypothetical protein SteCoe_38039 [Stentor coeruleus]|uniref:Uncharacterized protein n=1 Tax=Stentor coeruleus TaxID=5963 RepID=A0A1R2ALX7_9CILI|nr:hypothetical protein SteCoe_38039 [Stentor coeruleus]
MAIKAYVTLAIVMIVFVSASNPLGDVQCTARGGCYCNCSWANPSTCQNDDGSCCFACCCDNPPNPPNPPGPQKNYCPSSNDLTIAYNAGGIINIYNGGWSIYGGGAVATKAAFNLLGGSVQWDVDFSQAIPGVNGNIYTICPTGVGSGGFTQSNYCDGAQPAGSNWCVEVDWIESNGNCGGQTTLHDIPGPGSNGCTAWGCAASYYYNGQNSFHMSVTYDTNGVWTTTRNGQVISPSSLNPTPSSSDWSTLQKQYSSNGAVIYSSQWTGWVPVESCGNSGNLHASTFSIKNLNITGSVVQGPEPTLCSN